MSEKFDLDFSSDALLTRVLFLASETQVNVFVEDINKEFEYEEIFERLFSKELKIDCIFPTGGKVPLEEAFDLFGNDPMYGKCFFIADGDFDIALNKNMKVADNFIYLKRYNIESYLLDKTSILRFMRPRLKKTLAETENIVDYDYWIKTICPYYKKLFALHCVVQKYCPDIKNVARSPDQFIDNKGLPKEIAFEKYKDEISLYVPNVDTEISKMLFNLEQIYGKEAGCFVCGKYFITSLKSYLNTKLKKGINYDEVKSTLISGFDVTLLNYVKESLYNYILQS